MPRPGRSSWSSPTRRRDGAGRALTRSRTTRAAAPTDSRSSGPATRLGHGEALEHRPAAGDRRRRHRPRHERRADRRHRDAARPAPSTTRPSRSPAACGIVSDDLRKFETPRRATSTRSRATSRRSAAPTTATAARSTSGSGSTATSTSGGASCCATKGRGSRPAGRWRSPACRSSATSTAAGRACPDDERDRQSKRNFYRIIDRFGSRRDLLVSPT